MTKRGVLLQALASTPTDIARITHSADEFNANCRLKEVFFSYRDIIISMIEAESIFVENVQRINTNNVPSLRFSIESDPIPYQDNATLLDLVELFSRRRQATIIKLEGLTAADWQRRGIHPAKGLISLRFLTADLIDHDIEKTCELVELMSECRSIQKKSSTGKG